MTVHIDYQEEIAHWDALIDALQTVIDLPAQRRESGELALEENIRYNAAVRTIVHQRHEIVLWAAVEWHLYAVFDMAQARRAKLEEALL
jgi:hypothetical protein